MPVFVSVQEKLRLDVLGGGPVEGLVGFFDVQFKGSPQNPADFPVPAPLCSLPWQSVFLLHLSTSTSVYPQAILKLSTREYWP